MVYWSSPTWNRAVILAAFTALLFLSGTSAAPAHQIETAEACTGTHCVYLPAIASSVVLTIVRNDHIASNEGCGRAGCFYLYDLFSQIENRGSGTVYGVTAQATVVIGDINGDPITVTLSLSMMAQGLPPGHRAPLTSGS